MPSMLIQALLVTLLQVVALAVLATQTTSKNEDIYGIPSSVIETIFNVPASIEFAYLQAIPIAWISSLDNPALASSVLAEEEAGIEPSRYSNEPNSVKEYFSTRNEAIDAYWAKASSLHCVTASVLPTNIPGSVFSLCTAGSEAYNTSASSVKFVSASASDSDSASSTKLSSIFYR